MSIHQALSFPRDADERQHAREPVDLAGRVRELGRVAATGRVTNVSIGGCRLRGVDLPGNSEIWVGLGNAPPRRARIVWLRCGEAGCQFYEPMTRAEMRNVMLGRR